MKKLFTTSILFVTLLALSCSKENPSVCNPGPLPVSFAVTGLNASVTTKTAEVTGANLSEFYVAATTGSGQSQVEAWNNAVFTCVSSSWVAEGIYWPESDPNYNFFASNRPMTVSANGATVAATSDYDVICAYKESSSVSYKHTNNLVFKHIFARIGKCKIQAPEGCTVTGLSVSVVPKTGGTFSVANVETGGGWTSPVTGTSTVIANTLNSDTRADLYLLPGQYTFTASYTLTKGNYNESFTKTANLSLQAGVISDLSSTLVFGGSTLEFGVTVTPWTTSNLNLSF